MCLYIFYYTGTQIRNQPASQLVIILWLYRLIYHIVSHRLNRLRQILCITHLVGGHSLYTMIDSNNSSSSSSSTNNTTTRLIPIHNLCEWLAVAIRYVYAYYNEFFFFSNRNGHFKRVEKEKKYFFKKKMLKRQKGRELIAIKYHHVNV